MVVANEEVGRIPARLADLEDRSPLAHEPGHVKNGLEPNAFDNAERHDRVRMAVHHGHDVRALPVDLAVDETLEIDLAAACVNGLAVERELNEVGRRDAARRHVACEKETIG